MTNHSKHSVPTLFLAAAYTFWMLALVFLTNPLVEWLNKVNFYHTTRHLLYGMYTLGVCGWLAKNRRLLTPWRVLWLVVIVCSYTVLYRTTGFPSEKIHLITYSLLSIIYYKALPSHHSLSHRLATAALLACLFGILDEGLQFFVPGRVFTWWDVSLNCVSGVLGLGIIAVGSYPLKNH